MLVRRKAILLMVAFSVLVCSLVSYPRTIWMHQRSSHWWDDVVLRNFGPHDWMENFRMSKNAFVYVCDQLFNSKEKYPN